MNGIAGGKSMSHLLTGALALALLSTVAGCGLFTKDTSEPPAKLADFTPTVTVKELWRRDSGDGVGGRFLKLRPLLTNGMLYTVDSRGRVQATAADDGRPQWQVSLDLPVTGGLGGGEGKLAFGTGTGYAVALADDDGRELWRRRLSSEVMAVSPVQEGVVVFRTNDGRLHALDAESGRVLWLAGRSTPALSLRGTGVPAIDGDRLVSGFDNGRLAAFSLARGSVYWEQPLAVGTGRSELERMVDVDGSIVVADGVVYAAAYQGRVAALTLAEGRLLWARDMSSYRGLSVDAERVYVTDAFGHVWALDRRNGGTLWQQDKLRLRGTTAPTPVGGQVVVGDYEGWLHWLAVGDGSFVARVRADSAGVSAAPIAGADGGIHVLGNGGVLSTYGPPVPTRE